MPAKTPYPSESKEEFKERMAKKGKGKGGKKGKGNPFAKALSGK